MLKVLYPICAGLDIHKKIVVATIASTDAQNITAYQTQSFTTFYKGLLALKNWLIANNCLHACMESTGKYWIPVFNVLEDQIHVQLAHPKFVKAIKGKKTDKKDSKWIADLFKHDLVPASFIPPKDIREIRDLARYRAKLVNMRTGEKNRYQNAMTVSNLQLASVISDPFGVSARNITSYLLSTDGPNADHITSLLRKQLRNKSSLVLDSLEGFQIASDQAFKMRTITSHIESINEMIEKTELELIKRCLPYEPYIQLLVQLPGISRLSAMLILGEIGANMSVFKSAKHFASWAGCTPTNNESAGKKRSVKISQAGVFLKPILIQCVLAGLKEKSNLYFKTKYQKIKKRRGHKKALIAVCRMMLISIYHMFTTGEQFNPCDYEEFTNPNTHQSVVLSNTIVLHYLQKNGFDTTSIEAQISAQVSPAPVPA